MALFKKKRRKKLGKKVLKLVLLHGAQLVAALLNGAIGRVPRSGKLASEKEDKE